jgi:hypothetical protein
MHADIYDIVSGIEIHPRAHLPIFQLSMGTLINTSLLLLLLLLLMMM